MTGNDDRIVADLGGVFPFRVGSEIVKVSYVGGLLGHFATDTYSAVRWAGAVLATKAGSPWTLALPEKELAHLVNMCNGALFDAKTDFANSVWGVKQRLTTLGLLPGPYCFHERGRRGLAVEIARAYGVHPILSDSDFLANNLEQMKYEVGLQR